MSRLVIIIPNLHQSNRLGIQPIISFWKQLLQLAKVATEVPISSLLAHLPCLEPAIQLLAALLVLLRFYGACFQLSVSEHCSHSMLQMIEISQTLR